MELFCLAGLEIIIWDDPFAFLEYEAYESMADKMIGKNIEMKLKMREFHLAHCVRLGKISISESAIVVLTATSHRSGSV